MGTKKAHLLGAMEDRVGRILAANGGTLFLDEIGNLPMHLQAKLLAVLAQREVTPVGANKATPFNVRILAATNMPLTQLRDERRFRQDLLFRLNTVELNLPALRQRQEDILPIANMYLADYARKYAKDGIRLSPSLQDAFNAYSWPGNIRELKHAIERAVILCSGEELSLDDFQLQAVSPHINTPSAHVAEAGNHTADIMNDAATSTPPQQPAGGAGEQFNLEDIEKQTISKALKAYRYNISHAAKALGLTRAALYRRMEKHGL
ncbi:sigma 54-interacting transcriptional regulator [Alteromonas gracilis]|uniref:sigma 54-interacting transcriptional regulator n=1 Tax=Alteromonas gracilis TaxID=1479524 RepID=UPI0032191925